MKRGFAICIILIGALLCSAKSHAQLHLPKPKPREQHYPASAEKRWLKHEVHELCTLHMAGRGYVENGRVYAARYLTQHFKNYGLKAPKDSTYTQDYYFPVNTFPGAMALALNKTPLLPGIDYLIDAASPSFSATHEKVTTVNLDKVTDSAKWKKLKASWRDDKVYLLKNADSMCARLSIRPRNLAQSLPKACYIIPQHGKLTWTVSTTQIPATVFYVEDTLLPKKMKHATVNVEAQLLPAAKSQNIIGIVPGEVTDSYIVYTAHYDHLGMMGRDVPFNGASDNASGTAMMMYLADYFAHHPQHYSIAFIAFSGEEAGLLGSKYFTEHPLIPLSHIKFLTNIDIMGDATEGITVVNATEYPKEFDLLNILNEDKEHLPYIKSRGKAANSDHYFFTEAGVPSFFIYSNGGKGYYHDVFDNSSELTMNNVDLVARLLIDFTIRLSKP